MKTLKKLIIGASLVLSLAAAGCDTAGISPAEFREQVAGYDVDLAGAIGLAAGAVSGVVVDAEYDDGRWEVEVVSGTSRIRVAVDPQTGATDVLSTRAADAEELAAAALLQSAPTSLAEALATAKAAVAGGLAYELEVEEDEYWVALVDGTTYFEVEIDPLSGEVVSLEEDAEEDPELDDDSDDDVEDEEEAEDEAEDAEDEAEEAEDEAEDAEDEAEDAEDEAEDAEDEAEDPEDDL